MLCKYINLSLAILLSLDQCDSANIFGAVFTPSYSHQVAFWPIWKELSLRGHHVTVLTTNPINDPKLMNLTEIDLNMSYNIINNVTSFLAQNSANFSFFQMLDIYCKALGDIADQQFQHPEVKSLLGDKARKFDIAIIEVIFPTHMAFAEHLKVPFIGLTSLDAPPRIHEALGNPTHPVLYPDYMLPFIPPLKFRERLVSLFTYFYMKWYSYYVLYPREDRTIQKHFGDHMPSLYEIQKNMSMLFINANPIFNGVRPVGPNTIQIGGGMHLRKTSPLPKEIQRYIDTAKEGLIYFSLGTNVKSKDLKKTIKTVILETFRKLPYKILWKFENEKLPDMPKNVKIMKWIPQQDLFKHPNVKLFITQCGLQSMEEAIFNHIPMIGMPFFGDQVNNARILESKGFGKQIRYQDLNVDSFTSTILEVINNPMYRNNMKETAELYSDMESSGLEKAIWWTEYVLRHKGAKHFRSPVIDMPLYQYFLLDVICFLFAVLAVFICSILLCCKCLVRCICKKKSKVD